MLENFLNKVLGLNLESAMYLSIIFGLFIGFLIIILLEKVING